MGEVEPFRRAARDCRSRAAQKSQKAESNPKSLPLWNASISVGVAGAGARRDARCRSIASATSRRRRTSASAESLAATLPAIAGHGYRFHLDAVVWATLSAVIASLPRCARLAPPRVGYRFGRGVCSQAASTRVRALSLASGSGHLSPAACLARARRGNAEASGETTASRSRSWRAPEDGVETSVTAVVETVAAPRRARVPVESGPTPYWRIAGRRIVQVLVLPRSRRGHLTRRRPQPHRLWWSQQPQKILIAACHGEARRCSVAAHGRR
jgi:hypothetical protein